MRYFTNNPLERLMMQVPRTEGEAPPPPSFKGHPCYGRKRHGAGCVQSGYQNVQPSKRKEEKA